MPRSLSFSLSTAGLRPDHDPTVHCLRCHTRYVPEINHDEACKIPHVFRLIKESPKGKMYEFECCRNGLFFSSVSTTMDFCFTGYHTDNSKDVYVDLGASGPGVHNNASIWPCAFSVHDRICIRRSVDRFDKPVLRSEIQMPDHEYDDPSRVSDEIMRWNEKNREAERLIRATIKKLRMRREAEARLSAARNSEAERGDGVEGVDEGESSTESGTSETACDVGQDEKGKAPKHPRFSFEWKGSFKFMDFMEEEMRKAEESAEEHVEKLQMSEEGSDTTVEDGEERDEEEMCSRLMKRLSIIIEEPDMLMDLGSHGG